MIQQAIIIAHVLVCIAMVGIILLQQGKGAEAGASFGSGGSQTVMGASGSASLLTRVTTFLTVMFFVLSFALAYFANKQAADAGLIEISAPEMIEVPETAPAITTEVPAASTAPATTEVPTVSDVPATSDAPAAANSDVPAVPTN